VNLECSSYADSCTRGINSTELNSDLSPETRNSNGYFKTARFPVIDDYGRVFRCFSKFGYTLDPVNTNNPELTCLDHSLMPICA